MSIQSRCHVDHLHLFKALFYFIYIIITKKLKKIKYRAERCKTWFRNVLLDIPLGLYTQQLQSIRSKILNYFVYKIIKYGLVWFQWLLTQFSCLFPSVEKFVGQKKINSNFQHNKLYKKGLL